jgi:hypothetical protein
MAEVIGEIVCPLCVAAGLPREVSELRATKGGQPYYNCACGQHFLRGHRGRDVALSVATYYGASTRTRAGPRAGP